MTVRPKRWAVVALSALGVGLIVMPAVFQLWSRAPKGATMIGQFKPYMTDPRLASYQRDLREIDAGVKEADTRAAVAIVGSGPAARRRFDTRFPDFADFRRQWAPIDADMTDMLGTIRANVGNYDAVAFFDPRDPAALADLMQAEMEGRSPMRATRLPMPEPPFTASWPELMRLLTSDSA